MNITKKNKGILERWHAVLGLSGTVEKTWFWLAFVLLTVYLEFVIFSQNFIAGFHSALVTAVCAVAVVPVCFVGVFWCARLEMKRGVRKENRRKTALIAAGAFALTLTVMGLWLAAGWPGTLSPDSFNQLSEVFSGLYNNWHPVLQTWLFIALPVQLFGCVGAATAMQIVWFSLAVAYLYSVLYRTGCPWSFMAVSWLYLAANPNNGLIMTTIWKDSAMSILALVWFSQLVQIFASNGYWLKKWYNTAAFCLASFLTNAMRHNAVLLVAPVFVVLLIFFKNTRRRIAVCALIVAATVLVFNGPVLRMAKVELSSNQVVETMGTPMTILCNVYVKDPSAMSDEARAFMADLATPEEWANNYWTGSFNSIKWSSSQDLETKVNETSPAKLLQYTAEAVIARPGLSFDAFARLTSLVWGLDGQRYWTLGQNVYFNNYGIVQQGNETLRSDLNEYSQMCASGVTKYLFFYTGTLVLLMLFMAVGRLGSGGLANSFLVLAPLAYDFGTMLLLSGPDFRFFHFNFVIVVPLIYILMMKQRKAEKE
ncbi:MAG TPA: hypothetical protein H9865_03210 [Candidatus Fournierella pullicola]|uniref:Uncharacterized protein n=1 Tax=Candidatus Allofournierella pullicola TaxID=2838596 RepID=A0A9D2ACV0_9FIRM|nr:hypothetical protein [Candidatus Fournierella pullicola]